MRRRRKKLLKCKEINDRNFVSSFLRLIISIYLMKQLFLSTKSALESISEGSCDTEDWSNDAENQLYHHRNKLQFKIIILTCKNISQYYSIYCILSNECSLGDHKRLFSKYFPKLLNGKLSAV